MEIQQTVTLSIFINGNDHNGDVPLGVDVTHADSSLMSK